QRSVNLLTDAFPVAPVELLPEWELTLGLPDPCAGEDPTIALRQQSVAARFVASGGQSVPYLTGVAAALGYAVTITEYAPARAGKLRAGQPCNGVAWAFAWSISAPAIDVFYFRAGSGRAGDPLASWGSSVLQCELQRIAPAHTIPMFAFTGTEPG
ncbi:MAG TPA: putative phage tail protein, partial [Paenirhodobacter sp.]